MKESQHVWILVRRVLKHVGFYADFGTFIKTTLDILKNANVSEFLRFSIMDVLDIIHYRKSCNRHSAQVMKTYFTSRKNYTRTNCFLKKDFTWIFDIYYHLEMFQDMFERSILTRRKMFKALPGTITSHDLNKCSPTHVKISKESPENIKIFLHKKNTNMTCEKIFSGMLYYNCFWKSFLTVFFPFTVYIYDSLRSSHNSQHQRKNIQFNLLRPLFNEWNEWKKWRRNWKNEE